MDEPQFETHYNVDGTILLLEASSGRSQQLPAGLSDAEVDAANAAFRATMGSPLV